MDGEKPRDPRDPIFSLFEKALESPELRQMMLDSLVRTVVAPQPTPFLTYPPQGETEFRESLMHQLADEQELREGEDEDTDQKIQEAREFAGAIVSGFRDVHLRDPYADNAIVHGTKQGDGTYKDEDGNAEWSNPFPAEGPAS